jgi:hypothetical protein
MFQVEQAVTWQPGRSFKIALTMSMRIKGGTRVVMKVCMQWVIYGEGHNFTEEYIDGTALSYEVSQQAVFLVIALWIFLLHSLRLP